MDARGPRNECGMSASSLTFVGVHHVGLPVTDIERSRTWYEEVVPGLVDFEWRSPA